MNHSQKYLAEAKIRLGLSKDKDFADALGISAGAICHYQSGERVMDDSTALRIAEILQVEPIKVIAAANADREKGEKKEIWENFYKRLGGIAAGLFVAVNLIMTPTPSPAGQLLKSEGSIPYIMLIRWRIIGFIKKTLLVLVKQISPLCIAVLGIRQIPA